MPSLVSVQSTLSQSQIIRLLRSVGGWMGGWRVAGSTENKAKHSQLEQGLGLSLLIIG